ncbi:uncharacterized protein EI90DRAFT_3022728 [Cantharellus anzutake]|uniref:uncharacterized protein n=1 Tax=Cantharellus anzutake TaxID=1750568 RepID=UPI001907CCE0|nr:uncharacterized protein EI90DRAFT_3022728 [Cantharellus anzutake]KAF8313317.1 hypothetical protein EI90DRAFT_3022728 [Cantharellus anzutake]
MGRKMGSGRQDIMFRLEEQAVSKHRQTASKMQLASAAYRVIFRDYTQVTQLARQGDVNTDTQWQGTGQLQSFILKCPTFDHKPTQNSPIIGEVTGHSDHSTGDTGTATRQRGGNGKRDGGTTGSDSADTQTVDSGNGRGDRQSYSKYDTDTSRVMADSTGAVHDTLIAHNSQTWGIAVKAACVKWSQAASAWMHSALRGVGSNTGNGSGNVGNGEQGTVHTENMGIGGTVNPIQAVAVARGQHAEVSLTSSTPTAKQTASVTKRKKQNTEMSHLTGMSHPQASWAVLNNNSPNLPLSDKRKIVSERFLDGAHVEGKTPFGSGAWQGVQEQDNFSSASDSAQAVAATGMGHGWQGAERTHRIGQRSQLGCIDGRACVAATSHGCGDNDGQDGVEGSNDRAVPMAGQFQQQDGQRVAVANKQEMAMSEWECASGRLEMGKCQQALSGHSGGGDDRAVVPKQWTGGLDHKQLQQVHYSVSLHCREAVMLNKTHVNIGTNSRHVGSGDSERTAQAQQKTFKER